MKTKGAGISLATTCKLEGSCTEVTGNILLLLLSMEGDLMVCDALFFEVHPKLERGVSHLHLKYMLENFLTC